MTDPEIIIKFWFGKVRCVELERQCSEWMLARFRKAKPALIDVYRQGWIDLKFERFMTLPCQTYESWLETKYAEARAWLFSNSHFTRRSGVVIEVLINFEKGNDQ